MRRTAFPQTYFSYLIFHRNRRDAKDPDGLRQQAAQALYQAKEAGRNGVALPSREEMVLRSCSYTTSQVARLKKLAEQVKKKESVLLREALDDLLRKYDVTWARGKKGRGRGCRPRPRPLRFRDSLPGDPPPRSVAQVR